MFYRKWKIKNVVFLDVRSTTHFEAFWIKQGVLFFCTFLDVLGMCRGMCVRSHASYAEAWLWFFANACVLIFWRWGTSMRGKWVKMGTFCWKPMRGKRGRDRKPNLVGTQCRGQGGGEVETESLILWLAVLELLACGCWWLGGCLTYLPQVSALST